MTLSKWAKMACCAVLPGLIGSMSIATAQPLEPVFDYTPTPTQDSLWYYEIGGARAISSAPNPNVTRVTVGGSIQLGLGYSCGKFDPLLTVTNILNNIKQGAENMMNAMVAAAQSAIASLPALVLQRANPGLYDLFQNALLRAEETLNLVTKSCEQMEAEIAQGKNPFREWITLSKGNDWKVSMGVGGDILEAKRQVEENNGRNGLPWIGGMRGGERQTPIHVIGDTVQAGYNVTLNRSPNSTSSPPVNLADTLLVSTWRSPRAAQDWAVTVLGDTVIRTCEDCEPSGEPGSGILPQHDRETQTVQQDLLALVQGSTSPTLANLETVSAPGIGVTRQLIEAVQSMETAEQQLLVGKLAGEISQARLVEKLLLVRRLLLAGRQVPEIAAVEAAQAIIDRKLYEVDREIDTLLFEARVRKEVVSSTAAMILRQDARRRQEALTAPSLPALRNPNPIQDGAVSSP